MGPTSGATKVLAGTPSVSDSDGGSEDGEHYGSAVYHVCIESEGEDQQ